MRTSAGVLGAALWPARTTARAVTAPSTVRIVFRLSVLGMLYMLSVVCALGAYFGFYRAWVPPAHVARDVWLDYAAPAGPGAAIALFDAPHDLPLGDTAAAASLFREGLMYDVVVEVEAVGLKSAHGPLTLHLELQTERAEPLFAAQRPVVLPHRRRRARTTVPMLRGIVPRPTHTHRARPAVKRAALMLSLGTQDALRRALAAGGVRLRFDARLTGIAYYMYHRPLLTLLFFVGGFTTIEFSIAALLWLAAACYFSAPARRPK